GRVGDDEEGGPARDERDPPDLPEDVAGAREPRPVAIAHLDLAGEAAEREPAGRVTRHRGPAAAGHLADGRARGEVPDPRRRAERPYGDGAVPVGNAGDVVDQAAVIEPAVADRAIEGEQRRIRRERRGVARPDV